MALADGVAIAERLVICERRTGERIRVNLRVGKSYRVNDVDWASFGWSDTHERLDIEEMFGSNL